jgi:hypothetical protein
VNRKAILAFLLVSVMLGSTAVVSAQPAPTKKYIAFRDDDVTPFSNVDTLQAVNQVHIDENIPVTLGIIPCSMTISSSFICGRLLQTRCLSSLSTVILTLMIAYRAPRASSPGDRTLFSSNSCRMVRPTSKTRSG